MFGILEELQFLAKYVFVLLTGFLVTYLTTPMVRRIAPGLGMVDIPDERRIHKTPTPRCGISVFLGFHAACAMAMFFPWIPFEGKLEFDWWYAYLGLSSLMLLIGLADDRWGLRARVKLLCQIAVAGLAFYADMRVGRILGIDLPVFLDLFMTIFWIVAIVNAFNLIDGMDGLASGLACVACIGIAGSFLFRHIPGDALIVLGLLGSCLAFLRYNLHPASIFLGDSGSMFIGFTIAAIALGTQAKGTVFASLVVPLLAIGIPVFDTFLAIWRRLVRQILSKEGDGSYPRRKVFDADTDHIHHRLLRSGLSHRQAASFLYVFSAALVGIGFLSMAYHSRTVGIFILAFVAGSYVIVRHIARVELWDSALAITRGMRRPRGRTVAVLVYPVLDTLALSAALLIASALSVPDLNFTSLKLYWFDQIPLWVGIPFIALLVVRTYTRLWSRARISEYVVLSFAVLGGILVASAISWMLGSFTPQVNFVSFEADPTTGLTVILGKTEAWDFAQQILTYSCLAVTLIAGIRALPLAIRDAMAWSWMRQTHEDQPEASEAILIYGAGFKSTLFLMDYNASRATLGKVFSVAGFIDDDKNLLGRYVHGHPVLGDINTLEETIRSKNIREVVVTVDLDDTKTAQLQEIARSLHIRILKWETVAHDISTGD